MDLMPTAASRGHASAVLSCIPNSININTTPLQRTKIAHAHLLRTYFNPAHNLLDQTPRSTRPSLLNSLIVSYTKLTRNIEAFNVYALARRDSAITVDNFIAPSVIKVCAQLSVSSRGEEVHGYVVKSGVYLDIFVRNALLQMYSECGDTESAVKLFDEMLDRDVVSYSTMIRCYGRIGLFKEAKHVVKEMMDAEIDLSEVAIINMLNLFADVGELRISRPLHACLIKISSKNSNGSPGLNASTSLIHMYAKCGSMGAARKVFERMNEKSTASWSATIAGYIKSNNSEAALELFANMLHEGFFPNEITMLSMVIECGLIKAIYLGRFLHAYILRNGFEMSVALGTSLVDMYAKCSYVRNARALFDYMDDRDIMTWTVMISGYEQSNSIDPAFDLFSKMKEVRPNEVTMVSLLSLCAESGALDRGRWLHAYISKQRVKIDVVLATALVDMYAKCGDVEGAQRVFSDTRNRDVFMWNAMLNGLAMNGYGSQAIELFKEMEKEQVSPTEITFIGILRACSHSGMVEEGKTFFNRMKGEFGIEPKVEHYGCMVDLLGRAGLLDDAYKMIVQMPIGPNVIVWGALLAACKLRKNVALGEIAAKELLRLEPENTGYNVLLSNLYATQKRWEDVAEMRKTMKDSGMKKSPGMSFVEINGSVHEFVMGDDSHLQNVEIRAMVDEMQQKLKLAGYVSDTSSVLLNVDEEEKEHSLTCHSEKLAMAFSLISTPPSTPIRIVKNLRVCNDCHAATKLLSRIYNRVIVVRDRNRFHRFSDGFCSCRDYW